MAIADLKRMNIRVTPEMHSFLTIQAEKRGITLNAMCIFALETYVQQQMTMSLIPNMLEELQKYEQSSSEEKKS